MNAAPERALFRGNRNKIRNNAGAGGVAGSAGTLPTFWSVSGGMGLTRTLAFGSENGIDYVQFRFNGTTGDANGTQIRFETASGIDAAPGQTWTLSAYLALTAGAMTNIDSLMLAMSERDAAGSVSTTKNGSDIKGSLTSSLVRFTHTAQLTAAGCSFVEPRLTFAAASGVAVDLTLRVGWPQIERGYNATAAKRGNYGAA